MDRARRAAATHRRRPLAGSASPQSTPETSSGDRFHSPASPSMSSGNDAIIHTSPQTAPQSRRGSKAAPQQHAFSFSTPGSSRPQVVAKRSRTMDSFGFPDEDYDDDSPKKGGHSLRKRARVDYTFEHIDDDVLVPNSSTSATRRRRTTTDDSEDFYGANSSKKRGHSLGADPPSSVRRNPARKSAEARAYQDDEDVKDTIEVGVSFSDLDESDPRRASQSSGSSTALSPEVSWKSAPATSQYEGNFSAATSFVAALNNSHDNTKPPANTETPSLAATQDSAGAPVKLQVAELASHGPTVTHGGDAPSTTQDSIPKPVSDTVQSSDKPEDDSKIHDTPGFSKVDLNPAQPTLESGSAEQPAQESQLEEPRSLPEAPQTHPFLADDRHIKSHDDSESFIPQQPSNSEATTAPVVAAPAVTPAAQETEPHKPAETEKTEKTEPASQAVSSAGGDEVSQQAQSPTQYPAGGLPKTSADASSEKQPSSEPPTIVVSDSSKTNTIATASTEPIAKRSPSGASALLGAPTEDALDANDLVEDTVPLHPGDVSQADLDGKWAHLSPFIPGEFEVYPDRALAVSAEEEGAEETAEGQDADDARPRRGYNEYDDDDDQNDAPEAEESNRAFDTPTLEDAVAEAMQSTPTNTPAAVEGGNGEAGGTDSQELREKERHFKMPKLRRPEAIVSALENYEEMSDEELVEILNVVSIVMRDWQREYLHHARIVEEHESGWKPRWGELNHLETVRMRQWKSHSLPDFVPKGIATVKTSDQKRVMTKHNKDKVLEDWIKLISWNYRNPSKEGLSGQVLLDEESTGVMTRGRSLRNQPKQTTKATETEEVGSTKRGRRNMQRLDLATEEASRSGTPAAGKVGRRRKNARAAADDFDYKAEATPDGEDVVPVKPKRRRRTKAEMALDRALEWNTPESATDQKTATPGQGRGRKSAKHAGHFPGQTPDDEPKRKRHLLTLKIPKGAKNFSEPSSSITDNGDSRPSTSSSESTDHTAESSYSFRPKRQKRFRDEPEDGEPDEQGPPKKRGKRAAPQVDMADNFIMGGAYSPAPEALAPPPNRKTTKIKVVHKAADSRNGTPASQPTPGEGDERPKDYKSMTKSEKMSASMKSRWANGNMAGAVEKRKATLAAKKAAQAAADQKLGTIAPKPKVKANKKEPAVQEQQYQPPMQHQPPAPTEFIQHSIPGMGYPFTTN